MPTHQLINNIKLLRSKKVHSPELYLPQYYDSLASNPFVSLLLDTKANATKNRFPVGNMVKLTAEYVTEPKKSLVVIPVINNYISLAKYAHTSQYIINNRRYIESVLRDGSYRRFYPRKLIYKSNIDHIDGFIPGTVEIISAFYKEFILERLSQVEEGAGPGLVLVSTGAPIGFEGKTPVINIARLIGEVRFERLLVLYEKYPELCKLVVQYLNYLD